MKKPCGNAIPYICSIRINFEPAKYPLLKTTNPLTLALFVADISCGGILPGSIPGITSCTIWNKLNELKEKGKYIV